MPVPATGSAIVEFGANQFQTAPCDPIRLAAFRCDGAASFQFPKQADVQSRRAPAVAIDARDTFNLAIVAALDFDPPALREQVQDALFSA